MIVLNTYDVEDFCIDLDDAVRRLPARQRTALALWAEGYTYREIGTACSCSRQRAFQLIGQATRHVRKIISNR